MAATKKAPATKVTAARKPAATATKAASAARTKKAPATKRAASTATAKTTAATRAAGRTAGRTAHTATNVAGSMADTVTVATEQVQTAAGKVADTAAAKATAALKSFPSIDFSNFDVETLKQLDPRKIDWSKVELPDLDGQKLLGAVRDAAYTTVGFGVLAVQKAQVRRRELAGTIGDRFGANKQQVEDLIAAFESRITKFDDAVEARVDQAVSMLGDRLPDQAEMLLNQVHSVAKTARKQVRVLISSAA